MQAKKDPMQYNHVLQKLHAGHRWEMMKHPAPVELMQLRQTLLWLFRRLLT
jgi:hypothetical protein